ncbi:MAG TPA: ABC transporter ATP-binding protein [Candidatus Sulfotelmatobacter sp.]|jgi:subfamily B ATP-binding cassette protein MsbA|nr:ABC transporter ATP-binding protein [Candidatus Sulfotelmatobacter sp.]
MIDFLRKTWVFTRPYRGRLFLGFFCGMMFGVINGIVIAAFKPILNLVFKGHAGVRAQLENIQSAIFHPPAHWLAQHLPAFHTPAPGNLVAWSLIVGILPALMLVRNVMQYASVYLTNWVSLHAVGDIRVKLFTHVQNLSLGFFNRASTGELMARITGDTALLNTVFSTALVSMVQNPILVICALGWQFIVQPKLTLLAMIVFPLCIVPVVIYGRKLRKSARAAQMHNAELTKHMQEAFTANRVIKAYNLESTVAEEFRNTNKKYVNQRMRVVRADELPSQFTELFSGIGLALVLLYILHLPLNERPDLQDVMVFGFALVMIYKPIKEIVRVQNQVKQAQAATERVFELLATENSVPEPVAPKMLHASNADILFENVDFNYGEKPVLQKVNLTVKAGQMVALVGASGSGKTTLANLLLRFYDPVRGAIKIGGVDIREVGTRDLRNQIAVVAQENILFNDTIRRNIELGRLGATKEEIITAARHAHAYEFISQRAENFEAVIGEKGFSLSGGQRQRIAIARAVLKNAPILLLDEATSALDTESERAVQAALDELMKGRTTICIAHRLSTILHADMIVVLDQGKIIETGKHDELIKRGGMYQKLYELQFAS